MPAAQPIGPKNRSVTMKRILYWGLFGLTLAIYVTMLGWSLPTVSAAAGGLTPFDMRPSGYSFAEAVAFLSALSDDGASFYLQVQQVLDIFYPGLLALTLFFAIAALLPSPWGHWRWLPAVAALPVAIFDYLENHAVAAMITAGANGVTPELVAFASQWTVFKSISSMVAMSLVLLLLIIHAVRLTIRLLPKAAGIAATHPVAAFVFIGLPLSWLIQFIAVGAGASMYVASSAGVILGLALPAFAVTAFAGGRGAVAALARRSVRLGGGVASYLLAAFGLMAAMIVAAGLLHGPAAPMALNAAWPLFFTDYLPALLLGLVFIQIFEELAWSGFMQQHLQARHGVLRASLMVAPAFALSHLMLNYLQSEAVVPALVMLGVQMIFAVFFRIVVAWFYNRTGGSVPAAALFHVAFNAANGAFIAGLVGKAEAGWMPLLLVAIAAIAIVMGQLWRRPHRRNAAMPEGLRA
jgi:membrane protease YdiL (CAAX protease family)